MKTVILKMYDEDLDNEQEIILGKCDNVYEFCNILNNLFIGVNTTTSTHNRVFLDDIEIIGYTEYEIILEYIYYCYEMGNTLDISGSALVAQFLTNFGTKTFKEIWHTENNGTVKDYIIKGVF